MNRQLGSSFNFGDVDGGALGGNGGGGGGGGAAGHDSLRLSQSIDLDWDSLCNTFAPVCATCTRAAPTAVRSCPPSRRHAPQPPLGA